jgi:hypothetical protein
MSPFSLHWRLSIAPRTAIKAAAAHLVNDCGFDPVNRTAGGRCPAVPDSLQTDGFYGARVERFDAILLFHGP